MWRDGCPLIARSIPVTGDHKGGTTWHTAVDEFENPETLISYLEAAADPDQYAVYGLTVWATYDAINAAIASLQEDLDEQDENDAAMHVASESLFIILAETPHGRRYWRAEFDVDSVDRDHRRAIFGPVRVGYNGYSTIEDAIENIDFTEESMTHDGLTTVSYVVKDDTWEEVD